MEPKSLRAIWRSHQSAKHHGVTLIFQAFVHIVVIIELTISRIRSNNMLICKINVTKRNKRNIAILVDVAFGLIHPAFQAVVNSRWPM
jgi:Na+(H+)/acetate symporter ActP